MMRSVLFFFFFFFFQAEDGIRDYKVTGVQTCALPIIGRAQICSPPSESARCALPGAGMMVSDEDTHLPRHFSPNGAFAVRRLGRAAGGELSGCEATGVASMAAGEGHRRNVPVLPHWGDLFAGAARLAPGAGREPPDFVRDRAARRVAGQSRSTGGEGGLPRFCG